jgi:hypothetical protein
MKKYLVDIADTHGGHKLGLCNPTVTLYDEDEQGALTPYTPRLTASQQYLWTLYKGGLDASLRLANGADVLVLHNGDLTQGNKHPEQQMSTRAADHLAIAEANLSVWLERDNVRYMRLSAGTGAHNFGEATSDIVLAGKLKALYPTKDISVCYHSLLEYNGLSIDYAHHGPHPGSRTWLNGNTARFYLRDLMLREICAGRIPPRLVLRAHYHQLVDETVTVGKYTSRIFVSPSFCMLGDYAIQRTQSPIEICNGMLIFEITDGDLTGVKKFTNTLDVRTKEKIC